MTYKVNTGIEVIGNPNLPSNTIYCSMDIFEALKKDTKSKDGVFERLKNLYGVE